jgi:hypothetical protein
MTNGMLQVRGGLALLVLALLFGTTFYAAAQRGRKNTQRIQFPPGQTSVSLKGVLKGSRDAIYLLRGSRGQVLKAHLAVENDCCASILIKGPDGNNVKNDADGTDAGEDFSVALKLTGDYQIVVFPPDTAEETDVARYTLDVGLN